MKSWADPFDIESAICHAFKPNKIVVINFAHLRAPANGCDWDVLHEVVVVACNFEYVYVMGACAWWFATQQEGFKLHHKKAYSMLGRINELGGSQMRSCVRSTGSLDVGKKNENVRNNLFGSERLVSHVWSLTAKIHSLASALAEVLLFNILRLLYEWSMRLLRFSFQDAVCYRNSICEALDTQQHTLTKTPLIIRPYDVSIRKKCCILLIGIQGQGVTLVFNSEISSHLADRYVWLRVSAGSMAR